MTSKQAKRNLGRIIFHTKSGERYFLKQIIGDKFCIINKMIGYLDKDKKYREWKSEINYSSHIDNLSTKKIPDK
jgi:hypothetical protein